jgi:hypothetical protein
MIARGKVRAKHDAPGARQTNPMSTEGAKESAGVPDLCRSFRAPDRVVDFPGASWFAWRAHSPGYPISRLRREVELTQRR